MSSAPTTSQPGSAGVPDGTQPARPYTPGLSDGLGDRLMMFDNPTQSSVELLRFKREFSDAPGFEEAIEARIEELSRLSHPSVAPVRGLQMLEDGLALVSGNTSGRRLSEMVHVARGAPFAMDLIQQLAPALAALHLQGPRIAHGLLTAERIIITREGRLIVVEHVLASAFESLRLPATRLRAEFGIAVPSGADPVGLNQRSDVVQLGFVALSLLLGRRLDPAHYPANITTLLDEFTQADAASSARLRPWLERALQQGPRPFASAQEAHAAFGEPHAEIGHASPAAPPQAETPHAVLAFRPTADAPSSPSVKPKADIPKLERQDDAPVPAPEPKIELRMERVEDPMEAKRPLEPLAPPPVSSVASPRKSGSKLSVLTWIAAVVVLSAVIVGGLFFAGVFSDHSANSSATTNESHQTPVAPIATPAATPVPPTAVPAPVPAGSADAKTAIPPFGLSGRDAAGANAPATPTAPGKSAAGAAAGAAGLAAKAEGAPVEKPASAGGFGGVKVTSAIELQVFENGNLVGSTTGPIAVIEGSHTFELVNESLGFRVRSTVNVRGGQLTPLSVALPNGKLSINAVPWADVYIDSKPVGQTPLANLSVVIGPHTIVFQHPQFGEQTQTVIVKADGLTRVSATFKQP